MSELSLAGCRTGLAPAQLCEIFKAEGCKIIVQAVRFENDTNPDFGLQSVRVILTSKKPRDPIHIRYTAQAHKNYPGGCLPSTCRISQEPQP